jgi:hypothetical protein
MALQPRYGEDMAEVAAPLAANLEEVLGSCERLGREVLRGATELEEELAGGGGHGRRGLHHCLRLTG